MKNLFNLFHCKVNQAQLTIPKDFGLKFGTCLNCDYILETDRALYISLLSGRGPRITPPEFDHLLLGESDGSSVQRAGEETERGQAERNSDDVGRWKHAASHHPRLLSCPVTHLHDCCGSLQV